ncbi:MAG: hypothetical protein DMF60_06105 [Acidobacteria bacterium]|nr:MAG: hypothetical protein DMF60_06105 [Acidobacteriota bacterium]
MGAGTLVGDSIEAKALGKVLGTDRAAGRECVIGSVKTNLGHLEAAAGICGLIKVALAIRHKMIPPSLHFCVASPLIEFDKLPLRVEKALKVWPDNGAPALAGVSCFGFGGTNAHVVLQEGPNRTTVRSGRSPEDKQARLLTLSAHTLEALRSLADSDRDYLSRERLQPGVSLTEICYTASARRSHHDYRLAVVARSREEFIEKISRFLKGEGCRCIASGRGDVYRRPKLGFVFSGHGSQWLGMGRQLFRQEPAFRKAVASCDEIFKQLSDESLIEKLTSDRLAPDLNEPGVMQPLIFAVQLGLATVWQEWGLAPDVVVGHGMGEITAAHFAGALCLKDALRILAQQSRVLSRLSRRGSMAAVSLASEEARRAISGLEGRLSIAAINSPCETELSGEPAALRQILKQLGHSGVSARPINCDVALHSAQIDSLCAEFSQSLGEVYPKPQRVAYCSSVEGRVCESTELNADYWVRNFRGPARFSSAIRQLIERDEHTFIEISPRPMLLTAIGQELEQLNKQGALLPSMAYAREREVLLESLGSLFVEGHPIVWTNVYTEPCLPVDLPSYPWQRERCWLSDENHSDNGNHKPLRVDLGDNLSTSCQEAGGPANSPDKAESVTRASLLAARPEDRSRLIEENLRALAAEVLGFDTQRLDPRRPFISLGIDSLMAVELKNRIETHLGVTVPMLGFLEGDSVADLTTFVLDKLMEERSARPGSIAPEGEVPRHPLSYGQQGLWLLDRLDPGNPVYNIAGAVRLRGALDVSALGQSLNEVVKRHEALRTTFCSADGLPRQVIRPEQRLTIPLVDLSGLGEGGRKTEEMRLGAEQARRRFDLSQGPLLLASLLRFGEQDHFLQLTVHHTISDTWSLSVLMREVAAIYAALRKGESGSLPPLPMQYNDFARRQEQWLKGESAY